MAVPRRMRVAALVAVSVAVSVVALALWLSRDSEPAVEPVDDDALTGLCSPGGEPGELIFDGRPDGEVGSSEHAPWAGVNFGGTFDDSPPLGEALRVVADPGVSGAKAFSFRVEPGWKYGGSTGERTEVTTLVDGDPIADTGEEHGAARWYGMSFLLPEGTPEQEGYAIIQQLKMITPNTSPVGGFTIARDRLTFFANGGEVYEDGDLRGGAPSSWDFHSGSSDTDWTVLPSPIAKGVWHQLMWCTHYRHDYEGFVRVWHRTGDEPEFSLRLDTSDTTHPTMYVHSDGSVPESYRDRHHRSGIYRSEQDSSIEFQHSGLLVAETSTDIVRHLDTGY